MYGIIYRNGFGDMEEKNGKLEALRQNGISLSLMLLFHCFRDFMESKR